MQFPANRNFLCLALGGCLPLRWTEAESGHAALGWSHMVWGTFFFISTGSRVEGCRALTLMACPTYLKN